MKPQIKKSFLAGALILSMLSLSVFAQSGSATNNAAKLAPASSTTVADPRNEKVRSDVLKMVVEAKAGRVGAPRSTQFSPPLRNNLSKTAKIAIVAGIALVIIAIVIVHGVKNIHCESRCVI